MAAVVWEVLKVVTACHAAGVCHGDIKPANFLLSRKLPRPLHMVPAGTRPDDGPWLVAIDFGCAQLAPPTKQLTRRTGTPVYMVSCCSLAHSLCRRPSCSTNSGHAAVGPSNMRARTWPRPPQTCALCTLCWSGRRRSKPTCLVL